MPSLSLFDDVPPLSAFLPQAEQAALDDSSDPGVCFTPLQEGCSVILAVMTASYAWMELQQVPRCHNNDMNVKCSHMVMTNAVGNSAYREDWCQLGCRAERALSPGQRKMRA